MNLEVLHHEFKMIERAAKGERTERTITGAFVFRMSPVVSEQVRRACYEACIPPPAKGFDRVSINAQPQPDAEGGWVRCGVERMAYSVRDVQRAVATNGKLATNGQLAHTNGHAPKPAASKLTPADTEQLRAIAANLELLSANALKALAVIEKKFGVVLPTRKQQAAARDRGNIVVDA